MTNTPSIETSILRNLLLADIFARSATLGDLERVALYESLREDMEQAAHRIALRQLLSWMPEGSVLACDLEGDRQADLGRVVVEIGGVAVDPAALEAPPDHLLDPATASTLRQQIGLVPESPAEEFLHRLRAVCRFAVRFLPGAGRFQVRQGVLAPCF